MSLPGLQVPPQRPRGQEPQQIKEALHTLNANSAQMLSEASSVCNAEINSGLVLVLPLNLAAHTGANCQEKQVRLGA